MHPHLFSHLPASYLYISSFFVSATSTAPFLPSFLSYGSINIITAPTHTSACARAGILPPFVLLLYMPSSFSHQNDDALFFTLLVLTISSRGKQRMRSLARTRTSYDSDSRPSGAPVLAFVCSFFRCFSFLFPFHACVCVLVEIDLIPLCIIALSLEALSPRSYINSSSLLLPLLLPLLLMLQVPSLLLTTTATALSYANCVKTRSCYQYRCCRYEPPQSCCPFVYVH